MTISNGPQPLFSLGDTLVITGSSFEGEVPGYDFYSYYEAGTTEIGAEIGETYRSFSSNSTFRTDQEWSFVYSSKENNQGIVDLVVSTFAEYDYKVGDDRLIGYGSTTTSERLDGTSETVDFGIDYDYASSEGYELASSTGIKITYETLGDGSETAELEVFDSEYAYVGTASDINDWYQKRTVSEHNTDWDGSLDPEIYFTQYLLETKT